MCQPLAQNENRRNSLLPQNQLQSALIIYNPCSYGGYSKTNPTITSLHIAQSGESLAAWAN